MTAEAVHQHGRQIEDLALQAGQRRDLDMLTPWHHIGVMDRDGQQVSGAARGLGQDHRGQNHRILAGRDGRSQNQIRQIRFDRSDGTDLSGLARIAESSPTQPSPARSARHHDWNQG